MNEQEALKLYKALLGKGYSTDDLGDERTFLSKLGDAGNRKDLYDWVSGRGDFRIGDYDSYEKRLTKLASEPSGTSQGTVNAEGGYTDTEAGLDSLERGYTPVQTGNMSQKEARRPIRSTEKPRGVSYQAPYRADLTLAERAEIEQQDGFVAQKMRQMGHGQKRRNEPVVDTGDENVNRHIIKTKGQWEDEVMRGASRISSSVVSPAVKSAIAEFDKRADEIWGKYHDQSKYVDAASPWSVVTARQANEARDPEKILNYLNEQMKGLYDDESFAAEVGREADKMGVSRDEYMEKIMMPQIEADIRREFDDTMLKREMPKGSFDYIMKGLGNSIAGMLASRLMETEGQRRYKNEAAAMTEEGLNPHYTPGTGAILAQMGVSFAADAPFFGFYGKVGGNVAKGLAERQIRKLTAKGLSEGAARSIVGTALENSVGQRMKNYIMQHVVSGSITMGGYNTTSETARQVRDREFEPGQIIGSTAEGLATGAAFGLTGGAVQALSQPLGGIARIGSKAGGYLVEGETMYATEELAKMVHGEEGFTNPFEGSAEAMMKLGVMKVSSPGGLSRAAGELLHPIKSSRRQQTGVRFTPEEEAYVRESAEGRSLLDALSRMHPEVATTEAKGKRRLTAEGEQMRQELAGRYDAFMANTEIPYAVKAKVAGALGGLMPDAAHTPLETGADITHNADGSVILKTRDKDGNCMQELKFDSFSEADNWREEHEGDFRLNDAVNMWNGASPEARAKTIQQLMEEYGVGEDEAVAMVKSALGGSMGKDFSDDQFLYIYDAVRNNAYPADEPNTRRNYWEGQKLTPQERHQAMVEAQQAEDRMTYMDQAFADEVTGAADYADEKIAELAGRDEITGEQLQAAIDYYNKAARINGMMESALQGVDERVEAANAFVRRNTHKESGNVVEVESDGRGYYLTAGKIELNPDGTLNVQGSGDVMIMRDKETGEIQVVNPLQVKVTALNDPQRMISGNESMDGLRGRLLQEASDAIELAPGTPEAPQNGDYFTGADGNRYVALGRPDEQGNVVWYKMALDEKGEPVGEPTDLDIDEYRKAKSDEIDRESQIIPEEEISDVPETVHHEGEIIPEETAERPLPQQEEKTPVVEEANIPNTEKARSSTQSAFPRIPVVNGKTDWESASAEDSRAALTGRYGEEKAREMVSRMIANLQQSYDELLKKDVSKMTDMDEIASYEDEVADIKRKMDYWRQVFEEKPAEEVRPEEQPKVEPPVSEQPESVPELTESVPKEPESVSAEPPAVMPQEPAPAAPEKHTEPQPALQPPVQQQPQQPTVEQKIAQGTVKNNIGKRFGFMNQDGTRSEVVIDRMADDGSVEVTRQDYDTDGKPKGEPYSQSLNMADVGKSIVNGVLKPALSLDEKLRKVHKYDRFKVGDVTILDVLTDEEKQRVFEAYERGDKEAVGNLTGDFMEEHGEDLILKGRDIRNSNVSRIMEGGGSREDKLRRVRKQYQGMQDASLMLSDEAIQPATLEEYVADLFSRVPKSGEGKLAWFSYDRDGSRVVGMQDETGFGTKTGGDADAFKPWLAPKGKGMSLQKYAEVLHGQLPEKIQEQCSDQDVRYAVIDLFTGASRPSDITTAVLRGRIEQAEKIARKEEDGWIEGGVSLQKVSADDGSFAGRLLRAKEQTNTEPSEKQKEAGNYRKGHVSFGGYDFVIENPEGSMRRGRDADGNAWEQQMHNTYGYILGKKGKDGDHLDMFINDSADLDNWSGKVYVVDQVNADGTFDEHKILYGFDSEAEARDAYLSNYEEGWQGLGRITGVDKDTFDKWLDSSDRKVKAFAEHSIIKSLTPAPSPGGEGSSQSTPAEREKVLMDAVADKMREAGIDVSTDWEEGQRVIDEYNGSHELKPMGQKTNKKKAQVAADLEGKELAPEQQAVVDVYSGKKDNQSFVVSRDDGDHRIIMRQGNESHAGTKHSLFRYYGTNVGTVSSDELLLIPEIAGNGELTPKQDGKRRLMVYKYVKDGVEYTLLTEKKEGKEVFNDFYSNRKASSPASFNTPEGARSTRDDASKDRQSRSSTPSEEARASDTDNALSGAKVQQNPETGKDSEKKFFKTADGHAYGFTYKGKIYIDPRIATAETPIHEYGHLWAEMKRQTAPEEWDAIKGVLLTDRLVKPIIDRVRKDYPELSKEGREDDFIEEILTQFSGKRGAERLRAIAEETAAERDGVFGKAEAVTAMQRLKGILARFWAGVAKMMGWKYRDANDIADRMMLDMLEGVNLSGDKVKTWTLSDKRALNGEQFYQDANGNIDIVDIPQEVFDKIGYTKAPLRLTGSMLKHVQTQHGKETRITNDQEAIEFITDVMKNFDHVRQGNDGALIFSVENGRQKTGKRAITILLNSDDGEFYGIKTSGYESVERLSKRPLLWEGSATVTPSTDTATEPVTSLDAQRGGEQSGSASGQSGLSEGKDTKNSDTFQGNEGKSSDEGPKFQRVGSPEPEMTPEEMQYWRQWDAAMRKWKERNALPADADGPGEQPQFNQGESMLDYAKRVVAHNRAKALWQTAPKLEDYHQARNDKAAQDEARAEEKANPDSESVKRWRVATDLARLRHAMSRQKAYDKATVKAVTDFAQDFMKMGFGDNLGRGEMERLLSSVKNATGAKDIRKQVDNIMNILIDNQLRNLDQQVVKLSSVKELSKTAQGVEKQGRLELKGQRMIQAFRQAREGRMDAEKIRERLGEVAEKMARNDDEAPMWEQEYEGLSIALQYQENIEGSRDEWAALDREYRDAVKEYGQSGRSYKAQQELLESLEQAMMENKIERIGMFGDIIGRLQGNISESMQGAREFVEREKDRVKKIQQMANFDLAGKPAGALREKAKGKPANFFLQPLATFEQMLRLFGSRNANGEGYLYNHFMRSWMDATDKAYLGEKAAKEELDAKAREVFGDKVKRWSDLYGISRKLPTLEVDVLDGENRRTFTLSQGNLLYIYMADKMTDGRMKLRKMGIDEETVEKVKDFLDPRLVQLGDWLQDEYLVQKRTEYNKVHERMFGAPMAAIDHYFPLKILGDARYQEHDVSNMAGQDAVLPSTITGNIIKRRKNALPLDILHADALSLAIEHVEDMERWAATAEWNKDINTLLSYTTFRNKVKNMNSKVYGSGDALWNTFADTARMAAGTYRPKAKPGSVDAAISNIAKGVTAAKISFRVYTAMKQWLSLPAFFHDVRIDYLLKNIVNSYGTVKWAYKNMPVYQKRWNSRQVGDTRLMDDPTDWKIWKKGWVDGLVRGGMLANAAVDALTIAWGARSIYDSRYRKYKKIGASDELAHKRALQDAEIGYNLTQQSSEGAFVSAIQKDRTVAANMLSVFRNSSMAYTRQWVDAARNLKHRTQKGYKEDAIGFMTRQLQEQFGIDEAQAKKAAEAEYARAGRHDVARLLNMMFGVTVAWNLGASLPYLLIGDDDETKKEMLTDALLRGLAAGPTEGFAAGNLFSEFISRSFASEQTRKAFRNEGWGAAIDAGLKQGGDYEVNPLPLMADIQGMIKKMGYDKFAAAQDVFNICVQSAVGVNPQTFTDMWNAIMDYGAPGWDGTSYSWDKDNLARPKEIALFIMRLMNAPTSSWRNKYIDELGMNAEDAKKLSYEEMARRYAHYKHWKDAPIMGWLRGEEGRQEKMAKIRKQFDKAVEERLGRADYEALQHKLGSTDDEGMKKAVLSEMKKQVTTLTDKDVLDRQKASEDDAERKMLSGEIKKRAKDFSAGISSEALADSINSTPSLERKNGFVSEYAKRQGTQDYYGKSSSNAVYQELRTYEDVREDIKLSELYKRVKESGDESARKAIDKLRREISKQKNALGDDDEANEEIMRDIRQWRREALEKAVQAESGQ